jgi:hypothetical protein
MNAATVAALLSTCRFALAGHHQALRLAAARFFVALGGRLAEERARQRARDLVEASAFTVFEWLRPDENRLSDIFAELLDAEGSHGQGSLFLNELLRVAGVPAITGLDEAKAWREEETWLIDNPLRRMDIAVELPGFGIGIENKPWASDETDQVADYVEYLRRRYGSRFLFLYWSGRGAAPASLTPAERETLERQGRLRVWGYQRELRAWLEASRQACQAEKVRWFLDDLLGYLARTFTGVAALPEEAP